MVLLKNIFTVGQFLSIAPSSTKSKSANLFKKIYAAFFATFMIVGTVKTLIYENFYLKYVHVKTVVCLLTDLNLLVLILAGIINSSFRKSGEWRKLLKILEVTSQVPNAKTSKMPTLWFILIHIVLVLIQISETYVVLKARSWKLAVRLGTGWLRMYTRSIYVVLVWEVLNLLHLKFKLLSTLLSDFSCGVPARDFALVAKKITNIVFVLKDAVDTFNDIFGWPLALIISHTCLQFLKYLDKNLMTQEDNDEVWVLVMVNITLVLLTLVGFVPNRLHLMSFIFEGWSRHVDFYL
jgi:hypothetical protein